MYGTRCGIKLLIKHETKPSTSASSCNKTQKLSATNHIKHSYPTLNDIEYLAQADCQFPQVHSI